MNKVRKKPELLAPAGNLEKLKWAIKYGADAVYIGGKNYSLRANNDNFNIDEIREACEFAHKNKVKVYVTLNIIFHNHDIEGLEQYLINLEKCKVDAIIISDPFVIDLAKKVAPNLDIFLSTQQSTINYEAVNYWKSEGIKRIILAREASGREIQEIITKTGADIEVFIHGAMCVNYSGKCLLSNYLTRRDSNRGGCSQICRWPFVLYDQERANLKYEQDFAMATKDLSLLKYIPDLIDMGVVSFKIEGRMRSIYYIATIVGIYRKVIDEYYNDPKSYKYSVHDEIELCRCANREARPQYFDKKPGVDEQYFIGREEPSNQDFLGIVLDYDINSKEVIIEQRNYFKIGDEVEIFSPLHKKTKFIIKSIKDEYGKPIEVVRHPRQIVRIPLMIKVYKYDLMRTKITFDKIENI